MAHVNVNTNGQLCPKMFQAKVVLARVSAGPWTPAPTTTQSGNINLQRSHQCVMCGSSFGSRSKRLAHEVCHMEGNEFKCPYDNCSMKSRLKSNMRMHVLRMHLKKKPYRCFVCGKNSLTGVELRSHAIVHSDARSGIYVCGDCGSEYRSQNCLRVHKARCQNGKKQKSRACETCGKKFWTRAELKNHGRTHTRERPFICPICALAFGQPSNLKTHIRRKHTGEKTHECGVCQKRFITGTELRTHADIHLALEYRPTAVRCDFCSKTFTTYRNKQSHLANYHLLGSQAAADVRPFSCSERGKAYKSKGSLEQHKVKHLPADSRPSFACETCGKSFPIRTSLLLHGRVHTEDRPHSCSYCSMKFKDNGSMMRHIASKHTNERPHQCIECCKEFVTAGELNKHSKSVHMSSTSIERRSWKCEECGNNFVDRFGLTMHKKRRHNANEAKKIHSCGIDRCTWRFLTATELRNHQRRHSGDKPYTCPLCPSSFATSGSRTSHVRAVHTRAVV